MKIKKLSKLMLPVLGLTLIAGTVATTTSCTKSSNTQEVSPKDAESALNGLIFSKNGQVVNADFELQTTLGKQAIELTWTSSNENILKIEVTGEGAEKKITAKIVAKPDTEEVIKLTASVTAKKKTFTKEFTVKVLPYSVQDFVAKLSLSQKDQIVWADFDLPQEIKIGDKTCPVAWVSSNADVIKVEDGKAKVTTQENKTKVTLTATLTYNNDESDYVADVYAWHELSEVEKHNLFYDDLGNNSYDIMGYVVAKAGYNESYKNGNVFLANTTLDGGYYCYRVVMEKEEWEKVEFGTRLLVKAVKSTVYKGLVETTGSQNGEIITDDTKLAPLTEENRDKLTNGVAVDNEFVLNYGLAKKTGSKVNLTGWKIKTVGSATAKDGGSLLTLVRGEGDSAVEINIALNKYSVDLGEESETALAIVAALKNLKAGDLVDICGALYCTENKYEIHAIDGNFVTKSLATDESSSANATKILAQKAALDAIVPSVITADKTIDFTGKALDGVALTYTLSETEVATLSEDSLAVTPTSEAVKFTLTVNMVLADGYKYEYSYTITAKIATPQEMVDETLEEFSDEVNEVKTPSAIELAAAGTTYDVVGLTYEITKGASTNAFIDDDGKLVLYPSTTAQEIEVTVTATYGEITGTKVIKYNVSAMTLSPLTTEFVEKSFYYVTGTVTEIKSTSYGNMYIEDANHNKIYLYGFYDVYNNRYDKLTVKPQVGDVVTVYGEYALFNEENEIKNGIFIPTEEFIANYEANKVKALLEENLSATVTKPLTITFAPDYNVTISLETTNAIYAFENNAFTITPTSDDVQTSVKFKVTYGSTEVEVLKAFRATTAVSNAEKLDATEGELVALEITAPGSFELQTVGQAYSDVTIEYTNITENSVATLNNGKLFVTPTTSDVTFTITARLSVGDDSSARSFDVTVKGYTVKPLSEVFTAGEYYYVTGKVTKLVSGSSAYGSFYIQDTNGNEFEIYKSRKADGELVAKADSASTIGISVGNTVVAYGYYALYTPKNGDPVKEICEAYIISNVEPSDAEKAQIEADAIQAQLDSAITEVVKTGKTITFTTKYDSTTLALAASYVTVQLSGKTLTITPTSNLVSENVTINVTVGTETKTVTKTIKSQADATAAITVTASYSGSSTNFSATDSAANAELIGLDKTIFSATSIKNGASVEVGLNKDGTIRLYNLKNSDNGEALKLEVASGYKIVSIKYVFASSSPSSTYVVTAGGTELTATSGVYTVNGSEVTIQNTVNSSSSSQLWISSIEITYQAA